MFRARGWSRIRSRIGRRYFLDKAHDTTFKWIIQPTIVGAGVLFVLYGTARNQKARQVAYRDPYYPPMQLSPVSRERYPEWVQKGLGDREFYCAPKRAVYSGKYAGSTPPEMPNNTNPLAQTLKEKPELWDELKGQTTSNGVTLMNCIKLGVDNPDAAVGIVAGDKESYTTFRALFDPIISKFQGVSPDSAQSSPDLDTKQIHDTKIDPTCTESCQSGKYVLSTRVRSSRNVSGFMLPPFISFLQRRRLEEAVLDGLMSLTGDLAGEYFPLHGSRSYPTKREGMTLEKEQQLASIGMVWEPTTVNKLSQGMGRHWPDARGVFHNKAMDFFVWVNEEDHMRVVSMQKGDNMKQTLERYVDACSGVESALERRGRSFMKDDRLGYVSTCPGNLGTGLKAGVMMAIPNLSARSDFKQVVKSLGLQATEMEGGIEVCNAQTMGNPVDLVNATVHGASRFVRWEIALEKGESIDSEISALLG